jgi:hypothetical protein
MSKTIVRHLMELDQEMPDFADMFSQLIRYARASSNYSGFLKRHLHLRNRLLDQGYKKIRLIRSLKKFIFRYQYLVKKWWVESDFKAPNLPLSLRFKGSAVTVTVFKYRNKIVVSQGHYGFPVVDRFCLFI